MIKEIGSIGTPGIGALKPGGSPAKTEGASFQDILKESLAEVNDLQAEKSKKIEELVTNKEAGIDEVMIALEEASVAFEFTMQVRNRLIEAYREVMRMQI
jgi:flagellar hook-basal body complex protein FliE